MKNNKDNKNTGDLVNPFSPKYPVDPRYFANRDVILTDFVRFLKISASRSPPRPENIAILGNWGIGKTSILRKFQELCNVEEELRVLTGFIPLNNRIGKDWNLFSRGIHKEFRRNYVPSTSMLKLKSVLRELKEELKSWELKYADIPHGAQIGKKTSKQGVELTETLIDLWNRVADSVDICVLMLDDIHLLDPSFFPDLRNMFQDLVFHNTNIMLLITGPEFVFEQKDIAEPFRRFFDIYTLYPFDYKSAKLAIEKPIKMENLSIEVDEKVIKRIYEITLGHPYFIAFMMRELVDFRRKGRIDIKFLESVYKRILDRVENVKFKADINELTEQQKDALLKIAMSKSDVVSPSEINVEPVYLQRLHRDKNLLIKEGRGKYRIYHPLFREYLRKNGEE